MDSNMGRPHGDDRNSGPAASPDLVVFDLDGTLVDSRLDIAASVNEALRAAGAPAVPAGAVFPLIGEPLAQILEHLLPPKLKDRVPLAVEAYKAHYFEHCFDQSRLYPGVKECLERMKGLCLAVATTKMTYMAVRLVEAAGLAPYFALVQGSEGIPYKPDPEVLRIVLRKTGKRADRSWMVGDTVYDIQAGRAAGMRTCAVTYGIGPAAALEREGPDLLVGSLVDLPERIGLPFPERSLP